MSIESALKRLGFTHEWLNSGIITEQQLLSLYREILESEDKNAEHYRSGAFGNYIYSKKSLTDNEINNIFRLIDDGPDQCNLKTDRILAVIQSNILNDKQLDELVTNPEVLEPPIQKSYLTNRLIRKITREGIEKCFNEIKQSNNSVIHEFVLTIPNLQPIHVKWFVENGNNKKIRNISKQMMNSKKFRDIT